MNSNSRFFAGAAILGAGLALKLGAPLLSVVVAVVGVGLFNWYGGRRVVPRVK